MGWDRDTVLRARAEREAAGLPLFGNAPWPETRPAVVEQEALALPGCTIRGEYMLFRATAAGETVYRAFCQAALADDAAGVRLSAKGIVERVRAALRLEINNSFTALLARDAESDHAELRGRFTKRQRTAV